MKQLNSASKKEKITRIFLISALILICNVFSISAQDCESSVEIQLKNIKGGVFAGQTVTLTNKADGTTINETTDANGNVVFKLPCNVAYSVTATNYTKTREIVSPSSGYTKLFFSYSSDMVQKAQIFAMDDSEKSLVDQTAAQQPDTLFLKSSRMTTPKNIEHYVVVSLVLKNIDGLPLSNEMAIFTGVKRNKSVKVTTDSYGKVTVYLLKGDSYSLNFKYNKNYANFECQYTKGNSNMELKYMYLGTVEVERRKKEEALRIIAEEKRIKEEREEFVKDCKRRKISLEEGFKEGIKSDRLSDSVISVVLNRNKWSEKLIVCDVTGSMSPYAKELAVWYQLHFMQEKNLQFVFFNDGDEMPDSKKVIGKTGGIYYTSAHNRDSVISVMANTVARGDGGDCPENNMEALIKGISSASPYKELVAIVDNNAPVKDIQLINEFNRPVHIILCGVNDGEILVDYLLIAWKTKGSVHTIEQDITQLAQMSEGQEITIGHITYRIMGGEFVRITKL